MTVTCFLGSSGHDEQDISEGRPGTAVDMPAGGTGLPGVHSRTYAVVM